MGRGQILHSISPSVRPRSRMASSSQPLRRSKYLFSRKTEFLYSTSFVSKAPLLAAGFRYSFKSVRFPRVWTRALRNGISVPAASTRPRMAEAASNSEEWEDASRAGD